MGIGDWGLGIGDWPIPNPHPQSPIPINSKNYFKEKNIMIFAINNIN